MRTAIALLGAFFLLWTFYWHSPIASGPAPVVNTPLVDYYIGISKGSGGRECGLPHKSTNTSHVLAYTNRFAQQAGIYLMSGTKAFQTRSPTFRDTRTFAILANRQKQHNRLST